MQCFSQNQEYHQKNIRADSDMQKLQCASDIHQGGTKLLQVQTLAMFYRRTATEKDRNHCMFQAIPDLQLIEFY